MNDAPTRFEKFVMKAIWLIMWILIKSQDRLDSDDVRRMIKWRDDYLAAGGEELGLPVEPRK